ncbi:MAG TPA: WXG100 family type VII secretion target [Symbiobacteriaceae bacterium]|nr:WXG100 family type VII secretion target [Symbiobacteriaceae bacterium]
MARILVTPEEVRRIATQFKQKSDESQAMVNELTVVINNLDQNWEGLSNQKFMHEFTQWQSTMGQFVTLLDEINKQLQMVAQRFENADAV